MNWKKRTQEEIAYSVDKLNDATGGYEFLPWLWYMRKMYLVGLIGNLALGWGGGISSFDSDNENPDWIGFGVIGFFGIFVPILIGYMLRRDYKMLKKGQSS